MGQYWQIVNIDKIEGWENLGGLKMMEFFFDSNPRLLKCLISLSTPIDSPVVGTWAGDRIICLGDYSTDLPRGIFTADDGPLLKKILGSSEDQRWDGGDDYDGPALADRLYGNARSINSKLSMYSKQAQDLKAFPPNSVWVLRNLSKKELVRSDKISGDSYTPDNHNAFENVPGLFQAMVANIGCSEDGASSMGLNHGDWAGDRFDIVMLTDEVLSLCDKGWKDISDELADFLKDLCSEWGY